MFFNKKNIYKLATEDSIVNFTLLIVKGVFLRRVFSNKSGDAFWIAFGLWFMSFSNSILHIHHIY